MCYYENREEVLQLPDRSCNQNIVIDTSDNISTKCMLLVEYCKYDFKVIICIGAESKSNLTSIYISNLNVISQDLLVMKM